MTAGRDPGNLRGGMKRRSTCGAAALAVSLSSSVGFAATVTVPLTDTFINLNTDVNADGPRLHLFTWPEQQVANAILIQLDLGVVPSGAVVDQATLTLTQLEADGHAEPVYTATLHRVVNVEPVLAAANGYTYDGANAWTANSCCYDGVPLAQADISTAYAAVALDQTLGAKSFDLTTLVRDWLTGAAPNRGLLINSDPTTGADRFRYFASSEATQVNDRPVVEVVYHLPVVGDDGAPTGDRSPTAREAGCSAGEYYDNLAGECRAFTTGGCACAAASVHAWGVGVVLVGGRRRRR